MNNKIINKDKKPYNQHK